MKISEYDSGEGKCAVCGKPTLHTHTVLEIDDRVIRVRCCKKCEQRQPPDFWIGILAIDAKRTTDK